MVWQLKGKDNAPNGCLMRTSIIGLWPFNVVGNAAAVCKMTHYDNRCVCSCILASSIIYNLVWKSKSLNIDELLSLGEHYDKESCKWIETAYLNSEISMLELDDDNSMAYTYRTLSAALWCYWHAQSFEEGLLTVVNEGGDADTNAAIACAILGAKFGYTSIPRYYVEALNNRQIYEKKVTSFINAIASGIGNA